VIRTGYQTQKGSLIRDILFPKKAGRFNFERDSYFYIMIFALLSCVGFAFSIRPFLTAGLSTYDILMKSLVLITITVPPTLPAAMTIGIAFSQLRLQRK
jgi:cation-transporting ATPase 13A2